MGLGLPAPCRQQAVAFFLVLRPAAQRQMAEPAPVDQLKPILLAGIEGVEMHLNPVADLLQPGDVQGRHRRQRKDMGRRRQASGCALRRAAALECGDERRAGRQHGRVSGGREPLPEGALPTRVGTLGVRPGADLGRVAQAPGFKPVWAVGDVLVEQACNAAGQIKAHHVVCAPQIRSQPRMGRDEAGIAQGGINPPGEHGRYKG